MYNNAKSTLGSAAALVQYIYNTSFGRTDNDTAGKNYWTNQLNASAQPGTVILSLINQVANFVPTQNLATATAAANAASATLSQKKVRCRQPTVI